MDVFRKYYPHLRAAMVVSGDKRPYYGYGCMADKCVVDMFCKDCHFLYLNKSFINIKLSLKNYETASFKN